MEGKPASISLSIYTSCVFWYFRVSVTNSESWDGWESEFVILVSLSRRPSVSSTRCSESARGSGARPASTAHQSVLRGGPEVGFRDVEIDDFDREVGIFLAQISVFFWLRESAGRDLEPHESESGRNFSGPYP